MPYGKLDTPEKVSCPYCPTFCAFGCRLIIFFVFVFQKEKLSQLCSGDLRMSIKQIMPALFAPSLARQLSLKGQNKKKGLADTKVYEVIAGEWNGASEHF